MPVPRDYAQFLADFHSDKFHTLWPGQAYVLAEYAAHFTATPDVAIELPTGAGKTLIALLIAETWRQEEKPVAILSANKTLARQMRQEADALGIPAILMEGRGADIPSRDIRAYQRATRVAIMNYWVYFNQNPVIDPAQLVIMDDAHLAEECLRSLYSVEIDRFTQPNLFATLITELYDRFPDYRVLADALVVDDVPEGAPTELVSFVDQVAVAQRLQEIIDAAPELTTDTDLRFRWGRLRPHLAEANLYVSRDSIWLRPYIYPLAANSHYTGTSQRLYMSATVGDPDDLSRRLGTRPIRKMAVPSAYAETTAGRRLIILHRPTGHEAPTTGPDASALVPRLREIILAALRTHPKSVWLCASKAEALRLQAQVSEWLNTQGLVGHPTWLLTPLGDEMEEFKQAAQGHLFVAGRFDGMDFRADECRLVVLYTLPRAINPQEEFITAYLRDASFMQRRLNQRIIQALGRCNRSAEDFGVYLLADPRFARHFSRDSNRIGLPQNIMAEVDMAQDLAEEPIETLVARMTRFLQGDFADYDADLHAYQAEVPAAPPAAAGPDTAADEVLGWTALFDSGNYQIAARRFEECWQAAREANLIEVGAFHGWQWAKALYLQARLEDPVARERALEVFAEALRRGGQSSWFNRMWASYNRALHNDAEITALVQQDYRHIVIQSFDDLLEQLGTRTDRFERWCNDLTAQLEANSHTQYQQGLTQLGLLLGYQAARPRHQAATDCRWRGVFGNSREVVTFEAKIEHVPGHAIAARDVGQAHNQAARAEREYGARGYTVRGTIVTHLADVATEAAASLGALKIVEKAAIAALWQRVRVVLARYRDHWSLEDIAARQRAAQAIRSSIPATGWLIRALDNETGRIMAAHLCAEWRVDVPEATPVGAMTAPAASNEPPAIGDLRGPAVGNPATAGGEGTTPGGEAVPVSEEETPIAS